MSIPSCSSSNPLSYSDPSYISFLKCPLLSKPPLFRHSRVEAYFDFEVYRRLFFLGVFTWPHDFRLLSSGDPKTKYEGFVCQELRPSNPFQKAKSFCYRKMKGADPGIVITTKSYDNMKCTRLTESGDMTYVTKYLCMSSQTFTTLKPSWNYIRFLGFDYDRCVGFNAFNLVGDMWANNYLCGAGTVKIGRRK